MESPNVNRDVVLKSLISNEVNTEGQPRKRRRLDNLTMEERALRRKLKNRVAAQTARDRKKARMQDLEEAVEKLERENKLLRDENRKLQKRTESFSIENSELRVRLGFTPPVSPESVSSSLSLPPSPLPSPNKNDTDNSWAVIKKESESIELAALEASQQQKNLILFLSVVTTWLRINSSLSCLLVCLEMLSPLMMSLGTCNLSKKTRQPVVTVIQEDASESGHLETKKSTPLHKVLTTWWGKHQSNWNPLMKS